MNLPNRMKNRDLAAQTNEVLRKLRHLRRTFIALRHGYMPEENRQELVTTTQELLADLFQADEVLEAMENQGRPALKRNRHRRSN